MIKRPIVSLALLFWAATLIWLLQRELVRPSAHVASVAKPSNHVLAARTQRMGIHFQGQRIGEVVENATPTTSGYRITEKAQFRLLLMGAEREVTTELVLHTASDFSLEEFQYVLSSSGMDFRATGKRYGHVLKVELRTAGDPSEIDLPVPTSPYLPISLRLFLGGQKPAVGQEYSLPFFDPLSLKTEPIRLKVEDRKSVV